MKEYTITLTSDERDLLIKEVTVCGCLEKIQGAQDNNGFEIQLTEIELEELLDALVDAIENEGDGETQDTLEELYDRLEAMGDFFGEE